MKKYSLIKIVLVAFALIFIIHQTISSFYKPITTESAVYYTTVDGFNITGVILRNEILVESKDSGILHFMVEVLVMIRGLLLLVIML